jgi:hypothetical protein
MKMLFAAVHESGIGTFETSGDVRLESAFRGKAKDMGSQRVFRLLTHLRHGPLKAFAVQKHRSSFC